MSPHTCFLCPLDPGLRRDDELESSLKSLATGRSGLASLFCFAPFHHLLAHVGPALALLIGQHGADAALRALHQGLQLGPLVHWLQAAITANGLHLLLTVLQD